MSEAPATPASPARPALERLDLGSILLETTQLTEEQLAEARERQAESGRRLADLLVAEGLVSADEVLEALSRQLDLPVRSSIRADVVDETLVERLPIGFCKHHVLLPLQRDVDGAVRVAVANPLALEPIDDLRMLFEGSRKAVCQHAF